jgi:hypothetical protein
MDKRVVFVGEEIIEADNVSNLAYGSNESLLDGDIIVFSIEISSYRSSETFQGLDCLDDDYSFRLRRATGHWNSELRAALLDGKTVLVFLTDCPEVSIATGRKETSGTSRNIVTKRIVETFDPYSAIPYAFGKVIRRSGERIKAARDLGVIATYWHEFGRYSSYQAYIDNFKGTLLLETQTGNKAVGGMVRAPEWKGTLVFLPVPDLSAAAQSRVKSLQEQRKGKPLENEQAETKMIQSLKNDAAESVANQFIAALVAIDKAARSAVEITPPPAWSEDGRYSLNEEIRLKSEVSENLAQLQKLLEERNSLRISLANAQQLKGLLYEKGKPLERAVLNALRILGFKAENLQEGDSEFDVLMLDPSGTRLIGEVEGKDDKAINIDKLDQLDRNLREDFARQEDEKAAYAIGILFGNAYRLTAPRDRQGFFTAKCMLAAKRSHIRLVKTTDLFTVVRYVNDSQDMEFAEKCRSAIIGGGGEEVLFPELPGPR